MSVVPGEIYKCRACHDVVFEGQVLNTYEHKTQGQCAKVRVIRVPRIRTKHIKPGMILGVKVETLLEDAVPEDS